MINNINTIEDLLLIILAVLMTGVALVLLYVIYATKETTKRVLAAKRGEIYEGFNFQKWFKKMSGTEVEIHEEESILLHHEYDGIKELDNHLPPWWINMFYLTVVFAIGYLLVYHVWEKAPLPAEEYEIKMAEAKKEVEEYQAKLGNAIDENSVSLLLEDPKVLANGKALFETNCAACHGAAGEGTVGPNLTDEYWLHGGSINNIFKTIKYGIPEKGMISWQSSIKPKDMEDISNYILSLQGSNPANAKAAEGQKYEAVVSDSTAVE